MHLSRTRFSAVGGSSSGRKEDIVAEFLAPRKRSRRAIVLCDGLPTVPSKRVLMEFFSKKGFWVFHPRYRGSWESGGELLKYSPAKDIAGVVEGVCKGFKNPWSRKVVRLRPKEIYIIGTSFGGAAALLLSRHPKVTAVVAVSPVVDWTKPSKDEPFDRFVGFVRRAFGEAYRGKLSSWKKLKSGKFYNPAAEIKKLNGKKIFIIHAKDDRTVLWKPVAEFAKQAGAQLFMLKRGGHMSSAILARPRFYGKINKYFKKFKN
ncbi:MAG: hypothetical protein A3A32_03545 [Candidatus Wildermuthbacteria bacterium RIFCSPLOWO2_01_FULL_48_35]|uniref:Peptidase S9 prolyl oligopeptidase catalytic domain-containing protein n=2 Tax=Parcubacteria group TaxID=1794811 RepID=A0A1G2RPU6_9BACT|nr:MAG: hypothetical protein A2633_00930 [Candidatus Sungbacteria bacterium RIFCSPHIGHO2_01_FULL_47_32]OHA74895.1 MAG: hypothetical protein A3A32_03545 [Candidatus Wildermuthbacteria bacterium RIFCSPLOWO2_01_FULL_48_35]